MTQAPEHLTAPSGGDLAVDAALEVRNLEVVYHRVVQVVRGVSLVVPRGAVVALLGPNGAGKTSTLRAISGLLDVHDGEIRKGRVLLDGDDVTRASAAARVRAGLAQVLEGRQVFEALTVEENLRAGAHTRRRDRAGCREAEEWVLDLFPRLSRFRRQRAGYLSGGEQQMLAIGRALMAQPRLLVLDEPSLGLAPTLVREIGGVIGEINRRGTAVLLVEQNAAMALSVASRGYVMENGKVVLDKPADRLLADENVREFYLGLHQTGARRRYRDVKHYRRRKRWLS